MSDNTEQTTVGKSDWGKRELGALWRREGRNQNFLSGTLKIGEFGVEKEIKIVVFTNKGKAKNERAPDFIVYEDQPREDFVSEKDLPKENLEVAGELKAEESPEEGREEDDDLPEVLR